MAEPGKALVTDFDGTITLHDFYKLAVDRFLTPADIEPWNQFRAGKITHFQAIRSIFARIRQPRAKALQLVRDMEADPKLGESAAALKRAGWDIVIASAGCEWYVRRILDDAGASDAFIVHANPGEYPENGPLVMRENPADPFYSPETGIDKAGIVRFHLGEGKTVAYAGDGVTDAEAALLVPPELRFARADLAETLAARGAPFRPFSAWSDIADMLLSEGKE